MHHCISLLFVVAGECKAFKEKFMKCLKDNSYDNSMCRLQSKDYLECRMDKWVLTTVSLAATSFLLRMRWLGIHTLLTRSWLLWSPMWNYSLLFKSADGQGTSGEAWVQRPDGQTQPEGQGGQTLNFPFYTDGYCHFCKSIEPLTTAVIY